MNYCKIAPLSNTICTVQYSHQHNKLCLKQVGLCVINVIISSIILIIITIIIYILLFLDQFVEKGYFAIFRAFIKHMAQSMTQ